MTKSSFREREIEHISRPIPAGLGIIENSVPISAFGNFDNARIATLSLNPSYREFTNSKGIHLIGKNQRLTSRHHLGQTSDSRLTTDQANQVIGSLRNYFLVKPYMPWFSKLETWVLPAFDVSYINGTATHLDLSQWATNPIWKKLSDAQRQGLLGNDLPFLKAQLQERKFETVLLNGITVVNEIQKLNLVPLSVIDEVSVGSAKITFFKGTKGNSRFLGWNWYLQSAISNEIREKVFAWLRANR